MVRRGLVALLLAALMQAACSPVQSPSPSPPGSAAAQESPAATATQAGTGEGAPLVVAIAPPGFVPTPFFTLSNMVRLRPPSRADLGAQLVHSALYRYDERLEPVPDLADGPCEVADDEVTITCRLVEAQFHNGLPVTADDVAFTYELARRHPTCDFGFGTCLHILESVRAVDERTVEFRLRQPDVTFLTVALPSILIESRAVVEAAYEPLRERRATLDPADFATLMQEIDEQLSSDAPDCEAPIASADALFAAAGLQPLPRDQFAPAGAFMACTYISEVWYRAMGLSASLERDGLDAIALAYPALPINWNPVGAGPWRFASVENGTTLKLEAHEHYHHGPPATSRVEIRDIRDPEAMRDGVKRGEIHWAAADERIDHELEGDSSVRVVSYPDSLFFALTYNLREGRLFADRDLRTAVELCIDKAATVDAATRGSGDPIKSPIIPVSWAYDPNIPDVERDVDEARRLIEGAGWSEGPDGIYVRDGRRLATQVFVADDQEARVSFMDRVAEQVRDCGIEFTVEPAGRASVLGPLTRFPHTHPDSDEPFEAVFVGWGHTYDPDDRTWHSSSITSAEQPDMNNLMGLANDRIDELLEAGVATYDRRERTAIYHELQEVFAEERPLLFAWGSRTFEVVSPRLALTDGELNFTSRQWPWQLEKLVLREGG